MTTFDDDMVRLNLTVGTKTMSCKALGLEWPPPMRIYLGRYGVREATDGDASTFVLQQVSMSQITDEERVKMSHVIRGAEYNYPNLTTENTEND